MSEMNAEKVVCKQCEAEFNLPEEVVKQYLDKGLEAPKRCPRCREKNRIIKIARDTVDKRLNELGLIK